MNESIECERSPFKRPDIFAEPGEFEIASDKFGIETSVLEHKAQHGELVDLTNDIWDELENTDSNDIEFGNFEKVKELSEQLDVPRDWEDLKDKMQLGKTIDAPMILKYGDRYHKVSGNTRLMIAKALGITPQVWLFEVEG